MKLQCSGLGEAIRLDRHPTPTRTVGARVVGGALLQLPAVAIQHTIRKPLDDDDDDDDSSPFLFLRPENRARERERPTRKHKTQELESRVPSARLPPAP